MKHVKMLGLLVMAAASLMAFAGSAMAAPNLTSPVGVEYTGEIHATLATPQSALLQAGIEDTCGESTVKGKVTTNNETHAAGAITALTFGDCTKDTTVLKNGELTIKDGTITDIGSEVTVKDTALGISCVYGGGSGTDIGKLTEGEPARIDINTTELPKISGGFFCAAKGTWTGEYTVTTPKSLYIT